MTPGRLFTRLVNIMQRLRSPGGCPWDRAQSPSSLTRFIIEECYEVVEGVERGSGEELREELGDLLLVVVFLAQMEKEIGRFDIVGVLEGIVEKLERRHPHVFGEGKAESAEEVLEVWRGLKQAEKDREVRAIPAWLPALARAQAVQAEASGIGFDWPDASGPEAKVMAEMKELRAAAEGGDRDAVQEEAGDLLFSAVNLCRLLGLDAETALRLTVNKFENRMKWMEAAATETGKTLANLSLEEMDELWEASKTHPPTA